MEPATPDHARHLLKLFLLHQAIPCWRWWRTNIVGSRNATVYRYHAADVWCGVAVGAFIAVWLRDPDILGGVLAAFGLGYALLSEKWWVKA